MFFELLIEQAGLNDIESINEYVYVNYNGKKYFIAPYNDTVAHDTRLKIIPSASKGNKREKFNSFRIEGKFKTVDDENSYKGPETRDKDYKEMRDLACALAKFDYDTISNSAENTRSEQSMQRMLDKFELLPKDEIKALVKKGNEDRIKLSKAAKRNN